MIANPSPAFSPQTVTLSEIQIALSRIRSSIPISPCARSETFSELTGNSVFLKLENLQRKPPENADGEKAARRKQRREPDVADVANAFAI